MTETTKETPKVSYVTSESFPPEAHVRIDTIQHLMPFLWEDSVKRYTLRRVEKYSRMEHFVVFFFAEGTTSDQMKEAINGILNKAQTICDVREARKQNHPSSKGLVRSGPNPRHENKGNFTNVPPRVRRQR
jgi:hypothetical protein